MVFMSFRPSLAEGLPCRPIANVGRLFVVCLARNSHQACIASATRRPEAGNEGRTPASRPECVFRAFLRDSNSSAYLPTRRSRAAIRASFCWSRFGGRNFVVESARLALLNPHADQISTHVVVLRQPRSVSPARSSSATWRLNSKLCGAWPRVLFFESRHARSTCLILSSPRDPLRSPDKINASALLHRRRSILRQRCHCATGQFTAGIIKYLRTIELRRTTITDSRHPRAGGMRGVYFESASRPHSFAESVRRAAIFCRFYARVPIIIVRQECAQPRFVARSGSECLVLRTKPGAFGDRP